MTRLHAVGQPQKLTRKEQAFLADATRLNVHLIQASAELQVALHMEDVEVAGAACRRLLAIGLALKDAVDVYRPSLKMLENER